ncbi:MAG: hypothetical protein RMY35_029505 [Nostoc sp. DedSLP01]
MCKLDTTAAYQARLNPSQAVMKSITNIPFIIVAINKITDDNQYFFNSLRIINPIPIGIESKLQNKNIKYIVVNSVTCWVKDDVKGSPKNLIKTSS